ACRRPNVDNKAYNSRGMKGLLDNATRRRVASLFARGICSSRRWDEIQLANSYPTNDGLRAVRLKSLRVRGCHGLSLFGENCSRVEFIWSMEIIRSHQSPALAITERRSFPGI